MNSRGLRNWFAAGRSAVPPARRPHRSPRPRPAPKPRRAQPQGRARGAAPRRSRRPRGARIEFKVADAAQAAQRPGAGHTDSQASAEPPEGRHGRRPLSESHSAAAGQGARRQIAGGADRDAAAVRGRHHSGDCRAHRAAAAHVSRRARGGAEEATWPSKSPLSAAGSIAPPKSSYARFRRVLVDRPTSSSAL